MTALLKRLGALGIGTFAALLALISPAAAAEGGSVDLAAARSAAITPTTLATVAKFLSTPGKTVSLAGDPVAVYTLNADFVRGNAAPVGVLAYVANTAVTGDGRMASIWTVPDAQGWSVVNIASGNDEATFAAVAGPGALVFTEPQTNAWYSAKGNVVSPLNAQARAEIGQAVSTAEYQRLVHARYADKLPGSAYDKAGKAGGYGQTTAPMWPWITAGAVLLALLLYPRRKLA